MPSSTIDATGLLNFQNIKQMISKTHKKEPRILIELRALGKWLRTSRTHQRVMTSRTSIAWGSPPTTRTIGKQAKGQLFWYITSKGPVQPKETKAILNNVHPQHLYVRTTNVCPCPCRARTLRMTIAPGCRMVNHALPWARFPLGFQPVSSSSSQTFHSEYTRKRASSNFLLKVYSEY